jgi:glycosyltransferase involved in cell wall biosynthesis
LSQEGSDEIEVIAVNDGSPDGCGATLDAYADRDGRLTVLHLPRNRGLSEARNLGLDRARGEHVWFVDADDWLPPGSLRAVRDRLAQTRPDVLIVEHAEIFADGRVEPRLSRHVRGEETGPVPLAQRPAVLRLAQSACTKVVNRAFLASTGLRFLPGWYEDSSFSHPLLMAAGGIDLLDRVCYYYRQRPQSITRTISPRHFEVFEQYRRLFEMVDRSGGEYDQFRPELFRLMINHYLVILGNDCRLPPGTRPQFFRRAVEDYDRRRPVGYRFPAGAAGLKHRLVRHDAYRTYTALRLAHDRWQRLRRAVRRRPTTAEPPTMPALDQHPAGPHPVRLVRQRTGSEATALADEPS